MADKRIQDLTPADSVGTTDKFVLEQSGQAKSLTGQILINDLATALDGHGGISNITYTDPVSPSLDGLLTITMADETEYYLDVTNGRGISNITWTTSGIAGDGMTHIGTIDYNDGTSSTVTFQDGVKGNQGQQTYVWFKWADDYPTADADMQNNVGAYIGIYSGTSSSAPTHYTDYVWYQYKGDTGDTGASIQSISKISSSGLVDTYQVLLTNGNTSNFTVTNAKSIVSISMTSGSHAAGTSDVYTITFNDGDTAQFSVYNGTNGTGAVSSVSGIQADGNGDVPQIISGNGAPTTATIGQTNQLYYDLTNSVLYYCVGEGGGTYVWQGAGVTVDSALSGSSTNPVQNKVITNRIGTGVLPNSSSDLTTAVNYVNGAIPTAATATPLADTTGGAVGTGTNWAKNDHQHPLNVATSGTPEMDGTASLGSATTYAKSDHVHPTDTSKVSITGDTMTGDLTISNNDGSIYLIDPLYGYGDLPSDTQSEWLLFKEKSGVSIGTVYSRFYSDGATSLSIRARGRVNNANVDNSLVIGVSAGGTRTIAITDKDPWLSALGLGSSTKTTTISSVIIAGSGVTITRADFVTWGKIAQFYIAFKNTNAITVNASGDVTNLTVGTFVSGKRPVLYCAAKSAADSIAAWYAVYPTSASSNPGALILTACEGTGSSRTISAGSTFEAYGTFILP